MLSTPPLLLNLFLVVICLFCQCFSPFPRSEPHTDLCSFAPLVPTEGTSYGSRILMTQRNANQLLETLQVNPLFSLNIIGRPDYWAPQTHWESDDKGSLQACGKSRSIRHQDTQMLRSQQIFFANILAGTSKPRELRFPFTCAMTLLGT
jgi:hypothetical protein